MSAYFIREYQRICFCVLEGGAGAAGEGGGGEGGVLLHMNINLDSTSIIITGHKNCCEFLLTALFIIS